MQASDIPVKFNIAFASSAGAAFITSIPDLSQIGILGGAASNTDGFPPITFTPISAGGIPPWGRDFNGLFNQITSWTRWESCAGGRPTFDSIFSGKIGGYPQGALIAATTAGTLWLSLVDNNTANPDTGGANWIPIPGAPTGVFTQTRRGNYNFTVPAGITRLKRVRAWGGGGGGGGGNNSGAGAGGSGGSYGEVINVPVTPAQVIATTVGAGGNGGTGVPSSGGAGGATVITAILTVPGGLGGAAGAAGVGASTVPGGIPVSSAGVLVIAFVGGYGSGGANFGGTFAGGPGGGAPFGAGPSPGVAINGTGSSPNAPGGGGGGGAQTGTGGQAGASGADGTIIIEY